ncbi:MAG TPA: ribosome maturation factor RimM [Clostridia bacterium]
MDKILIGTVLKTRGIKGEIKVKPYTDNIDNLLKVKTIYIDDMEYKVLSARESEGMLYLYLSRVYSIEQAETLRGKDIYINREDAAPLGENEYYIIDILGCDVYADDEYIGKVEDVSSFGAADVYTVKGEKTVRFPFLKKLVRQVDIQNKKIVLNKNVFAEVSVYED